LLSYCLTHPIRSYAAAQASISCCAVQALMSGKTPPEAVEVLPGGLPWRTLTGPIAVQNDAAVFPDKPATMLTAAKRRAIICLFLSPCPFARRPSAVAQCGAIRAVFVDDPAHQLADRDTETFGFSMQESALRLRER